MQPVWEKADPRVDLGFLPGFLDLDDRRPAKEQFNERYVFGGWNRFDGFLLNPETLSLTYPGDPPLRPLARTTLHGELVLYYRGDWVAIVQPTGEYEVARLD